MKVEWSSRTQKVESERARKTKPEVVEPKREQVKLSVYVRTTIAWQLGVVIERMYAQSRPQWH